MSTTELASPDKGHIREFFDSVASRYDLLNSILSFNLDECWRNRSRDLILEGTEKRILDLGVGTGKYLKGFLNAQSWQCAVGLDFSEKMLARAKADLPASARFVSADFHYLPFAGESFDLVVSSFTLRSVKDMNLFLKEVYRILALGGKAAFLCLTRPRNILMKSVYYPYLKFYLPCMGQLISGHDKAYRFLSESIQSFQNPEVTAGMMREAGFASLKTVSLTLGAATLLLGSK